MEFKHIVFDHDGTLVDPDSLKLFSGIKDLLENLRQNGAKLYVWTARSRNSVLEVLKTAGVIDYFEKLSTAGDGENKPSPAGLITMLGSTPKHEIVVVGDSYADMIGARNYQVKSIGANWFGKSQDAAGVLLHFGAEKVFDAVKDLKEFLIK